MQSCKIKVRPQSCRSCPLWRPCNLQDMMGIDTIFRQNMKMAMKWKSSVYNLPYMMGIDAIFRQNMKMALKSTWLKIGIGPRELAVKKNEKMTLNSHLQTFQILTNNDKVFRGSLLLLCTDWTFLGHFIYIISRNMNFMLFSQNLGITNRLDGWKGAFF